MNEPDFIALAPLCSMSDLRSDRRLLPREKGVYAMFFRACPGDAPIGGCYQRDGLALLYIGTAGGLNSSKATLYGRIGRNHLSGDERKSTLAQTLAALMPEVAGPALRKLEPKGVKFHTSKDGQARLRDWMDLNIALCWMPCPDPTGQEQELLSRYSPPLNLDDCENPFRSTLKTLRATRRSLAIPYA